MRIYQLKTGASVLAGLGFSGLIIGTWLWQQPTENFSLRQHLNWEPKLAQSIALKEPAQTKIDPTEALLRPVFRRSRKPFDPSELAQTPIPLVTIAAPPPTESPPTPQVVEQAPVAPPPPVQTAESLQLSLKGIYSFDGVWKALFVSPSLPQGEWLAIGTGISGWKLTAIDPNTVTIGSGNQKIVLKLYVDNQSNPLGGTQP